MKTETYKGRKLKVVKARGADFGYTRVTLNGTDMGKHLGDEDAALSWLRGSIDFADEVGVSSGRMGDEWYAPGTFDLCDEGHAKEIGGECGHHWCVSQRADVAPEEPTAEVAPVVDEERPVVVATSRKALAKGVIMCADPAYVTLTVTAREIRAGDVFTLHGHERTATHSTWPTALRNHVHISFVGGGDAVIPADRFITVTRAQVSQCATA
jgi:hypothetical protein